jgi:hypothetical protein
LEMILPVGESGGCAPGMKMDISVILTPNSGDIDPLNCCFEKERLL